MNKNYFEIKRAGINTTFQDQGRDNLYHIGIPFSGAMDNRNFHISNKLVGNEVNFPIIEFAYQGPLLKYFGENINFAIFLLTPCNLHVNFGLSSNTVFIPTPIAS